MLTNNIRSSVNTGLESVKVLYDRDNQKHSMMILAGMGSTIRDVELLTKESTVSTLSTAIYFDSNHSTEQSIVIENGKFSNFWRVICGECPTTAEEH